jgi:glycopeptide antibiotics resistance protein
MRSISSPKGPTSVVRDHGATGLNLTIPEHYYYVQRTLLGSPLSAFKENEGKWGYTQDVVINIGGFVPFGFALSVLLASTGRVSKPAACAVLGGLIVSLRIEVPQSSVPRRARFDIAQR